RGIDVDDEEARLAVRLVGEQGAVGARDRRRRRRSGRGVVDAGEEDGVLGGAAEDRVLVKAAARIAERGRPERALLGRMVVRMEDEPGAAAREVPDRLGVAPAFVADHDAEADAADLVEGALDAAARVGRVLARIELRLVLEAEPPALLVDDERGGAQTVVDDALGAEHDGDARGARGLGDGRPGTLEERRVRRRRSVTEPAV